MRTGLLDPVGDARWQTFVDAARDASIFHHSAWLELIGRRYRYDMSALCVFDDAGEIVVGLPLARVASVLTGRRLVSLPFSDGCAPVHGEHAGAGASQALAHALVRERERSGMNVEIRTSMESVPGAHVVRRFLTHRLELGPDADAVLKRAKGQARRDAAKARREGVTTAVGTDRAALATFYDLHLRTRQRQGVPTQPKGFILDFERLFARGLGYVIVARHEGKPIASAIFMTYGGTLTYKYSASDQRFLKLRPNHLFFADAIRLGCERGLRELDFGRSDIDNTGLASFKRSWGAEEHDLSYTYLSDEPPPDRHNRLEGVLGTAIRRGPPSAGRVIGAALYRHVG